MALLALLVHSELPRLSEQSSALSALAWLPIELLMLSLVLP